MLKAGPYKLNRTTHGVTDKKPPASVIRLGAMNEGITDATFLDRGLNRYV